MINSYGWLAIASVLFFAGCAPGLAPMGAMMDPNSLMMTVLIVLVIFGLYLYSKKDKKQDKSELEKRVEELEKEIKEIKDKL